MKVAILANRAASFVRSMAEGLARGFRAIEAQPEIFYDGLRDLQRMPPRLGTYLRESSDAGFAWKTLRYLVREAPVLRFLRALRAFDVVVVVTTLPDNFLRRFFRDETVRAYLPKTPIVLNDLYYLPTRGPWARWFKEGRPENGIPEGSNWGMERYDWYLCSSVVSEFAMPPGVQPYSVVGLDLNDGTLFPEPGREFCALIDFEQQGTLKERAIQIQACEETKTPYIVLKGRYAIDEIRKIYRRCSIYFVAFRESFGLPICELQACGSMIFTPYSEWCPSHWIKDDLSRSGPGFLSPNFKVYNNDKQQLIEAIHRVKANCNPARVVETFHRYHPQLYYGDTAALAAFAEKLRAGEIHSHSHLEYAAIFPQEEQSVRTAATRLRKDQLPVECPIS